MFWLRLGLLLLYKGSIFAQRFNINFSTLFNFYTKVQHRFLYEEKTDNLKKLLEKEDFETSNIVANIEKEWPERNIAKYV